jgi:hypothetical protein
MSFFNTETNPELVKDTVSGNFITESGIYPLSIKYAVVRKNEKGSEWIDLIADYNGTDVTFYMAMFLKKQDGSDGFDKDLLNKLCIIGGIDVVDDPIDQELMNSKTGEVSVVQILPEFSSLDVYARIQIEYSMYNDKVQMRRRIKSFFRADKASASEIVNKVPATSKDEQSSYIGKQYGVEEEKSHAISYKNGLTAEAVKIWQENNRNNKASSDKASDKPTTTPSSPRQHRFSRSA